MTQTIGGQAVIEGVMIKSKERIATAVRKNDKIVVKKQNWKSLTTKNKLLNLPIIRGVIILFEMMYVGMKALTWSAQQQEDKKEKISNSEIFLTISISIIATILLFVVAPYYISKLFVKEVGTLFNLIDGLLRLLIFFGYIIIISFFKDVKRIFQYHGAEHMAVYCYEAGLKLTPKNCQRFQTMHPRCGTSLIVLVIAISIILFSLIKSQLWYVNILLRIVLIPLIAGIGYELTKLTAKYSNNKFLRFLIYPGILTQKITTQKPDVKQIEVAIAAVKAVL